MSDRDENEISAEERELAERGKALVNAAISQVEAPHTLRESIERQRDQARGQVAGSRRRAPGVVPWWRRGRTLVAALGAAAAVALAIVAFTGSEGGEPSRANLEAVASLRPEQPAPRRAGGDPPVLAARVGPIAFPDWRQSFGWTAVGSRRDQVDDRGVTTVYYRNADGASLAYAILSGPALEQAPEGRPVVREGNTYHVAESARHTAVSWTQQGHTCLIVASAAVPTDRLVEIAASRNT
jgi:hypothetical protein